MNNPTKQWMVVCSRGKLYAASNASTRNAAKERHYADMGEPWPIRHEKGDRLVRVTIALTRKDRDRP